MWENEMGERFHSFIPPEKVERVLGGEGKKGNGGRIHSYHTFPCRPLREKGEQGKKTCEWGGRQERGKGGIRRNFPTFLICSKKSKKKYKLSREEGGMGIGFIIFPTANTLLKKKTVDKSDRRKRGGKKMERHSISFSCAAKVLGKK